LALPTIKSKIMKVRAYLNNIEMENSLKIGID
jgi:hypothetical protein